MKNKCNIQESQKFNPPTQYECFMDGKPAGTCFVYGPAAWRNKNRQRTERPTQHKTPKQEMVKKAANYSDSRYENPIPGRV